MKLNTDYLSRILSCPSTAVSSKQRTPRSGATPRAATATTPRFARSSAKESPGVLLISNAHERNILTYYNLLYTDLGFKNCQKYFYDHSTPMPPRDRRPRTFCPQLPMQQALTSKADASASPNTAADPAAAAAGAQGTPAAGAAGAAPAPGEAANAAGAASDAKTAAAGATTAAAPGDVASSGGAAASSGAGADAAGAIAVPVGSGSLSSSASSPPHTALGANASSPSPPLSTSLSSSNSPRSTSPPLASSAPVVGATGAATAASRANSSGGGATTLEASPPPATVSHSLSAGAATPPHSSGSFITHQKSLSSSMGPLSIAAATAQLPASPAVTAAAVKALVAQGLMDGVRPKSIPVGPNLGKSLSSSESDRITLASKVINETQFINFMRELTDFGDHQIVEMFDIFDKEDCGGIYFEEWFLLLALFCAIESGQCKQFLNRHGEQIFEALVDNPESNEMSWEEFTRLGYIMGISEVDVYAALTAFKLDIYQPIRYDEFICYYFTIMSHIDEARNNETNASFFRNRYKETAEAKKEECCIQ